MRLLEAGGFTVWWDPSIVPGERYASVIHRALDKSACVVVAWSRRSVDSIWVQDEAGFARDRGVLVPVSLDGVDPPLGFRQLQTVSLAGWQGQPDDPRVAHFLAGVRRLVSWIGKAEAAVVAPAPVPAATIPQAQPGKASGFRHARTAVLVGVCDRGGAADRRHAVLSDPEGSDRIELQSRSSQGSRSGRALVSGLRRRLPGHGDRSDRIVSSWDRSTASRNAEATKARNTR